MNSKKIFLFSFFLSLGVLLNAQTENTAVVWRGFEHSWSYNHRINRIGNYVKMVNSDPYGYHASASGLGSDSTWFKTYYTVLKSKVLEFKEAVVDMKIEGNEGDLLTRVIDLNIKLDDKMIKKQKFKVFINGFEMKSLLKADQLSLCRFTVDDPSISTETSSLNVKAHLNLVTNCRTIECPLFSNKTAYALQLHLLVIGYNSEDAETFEGYKAKSYTWDETIEIPETFENISMHGQRNEFEKAFVGIKSIGIILDQEHWLKDINYSIVPEKYDPKTGQMDALIKMFYREWQNGMKLFATDPKKAGFAEKRAGFALLDMTPIFMQVKSAQITHGNTKGSMFWKGWNANSSSDEALSKTKINH
jgi:hypothetical protein